MEVSQLFRLSKTLQRERRVSHPPMASRKGYFVSSPLAPRGNNARVDTTGLPTRPRSAVESRVGSGLVGRAQESALIGKLLEEADSGNSRVLVVHGEPGIGKTALLEHAVAG